jgi:hypothetical protein
VDPRGPDGAPIRDAHVWLGGGGFVRHELGAGRRMRDGTVWLPLGGGSHLASPTEPLFVEVETPFGITKRIEVPPSLCGRVEARFGEAATLLVEARGFRREAHEGVLAFTVGRPNQPGRGLRGQWDFFDATGHVALGPVEPGVYQAVLLSEAMGGNSIENVPVSVAELRLEPGENRLIVEVPPLYDLTVFLDDPHEVIDLVPERDACNWLLSSSRSTRVEFKHVPAGTYELRNCDWGGGRMERMRLRLPGPSELRFKPE